MSKRALTMGNELRVNTDLEYVLMPLKYQTPRKELFAILETTYSYRNRGRLSGRVVPGSSSSEFYLAPGPVHGEPAAGP